MNEQEIAARFVEGFVAAQRRYRKESPRGVMGAITAAVLPEPPRRLVQELIRSWVPVVRCMVAEMVRAELAAQAPRVPVTPGCECAGCKPVPGCAA